jgi:membrane protein
MMAANADKAAPVSMPYHTEPRGVGPVTVSDTRRGTIVADDQTSRSPEADRGREVERPQDIPARGWKDVLIRAYGASSQKNLSLVAGGVTYYVLLALFPALAALVSIYGLVADPAQVEKQVGALSGLVPGSAQKLIGDELHQLVSSSGSALSIGVVVGLLISIWSASRGMSGMMTALDIAYGQEERRSFFRFNLVAIALTAVLIAVGMVSIALIAGLPAVVSGGGASSITKWVSYVVEWPLLIVLMVAMLAVLYRYAPDRRKPRWEWISPGAAMATLLWIAGSALFTVYVAHFGNYNKTYGSLGALIALLTWLWLSAYAVLLGAEINGQSERQTRHDSTVGRPESMGQRGAYAADTVGKARS